MKRLVFCFDGTWNRLDAPAPTNVVLTAQSVSPVAKDGVVQIIHYDQGVGTGKSDKWSGGLLGGGLLDKIVTAYTFLIFNYEVGDEIYIFGFSRGAFTARSFVGMLRTVGILPRAAAGKVTAAVKQYQSRKSDEGHNSDALLRYRMQNSPIICIDQQEDAWRCQNQPGYRTGSSPVFRIRYVGVWDTVGSLGVPDTMLIAPLANKGNLFYDTNLSDLVVSARHAVSIDEKRKSFAPTLWTNFEALNHALGFEPGAKDAPYQQQWFPGTHGSVGGGGPIRGLSDFALDWIVTGARRAGLQLDTTDDSQAFSLAPDHLAALENVTETKFSLTGFLMSKLPTAARLPGPFRVSEVSASAVQRWAEPASRLPEGVLYRPPTLAGVSKDLDALAAGAPVPAAIIVAAPPTAQPVPGAYYRVVRGDQLRAIALRAYHDADRADLILDANAAILTDPDRIYIGQVLYLPQSPPPG